MLTPEQRETWRRQTVGQPGPQKDREESISFQTRADGAEMVSIYTTRPGTVADLIDAGRPIVSIVFKLDIYHVLIPATEYRMGGIVGALRRHSTMSPEQRQAVGDRLRAARVS